MDLNKVQIIGNITQDMELKATPNWQSVISFGVATNRTWKDNDGNQQQIAEFHNIVLWWKLAEIANQYCYKWKKIYIEGRLQTRSWDAQDGTKRYKTEVVGENLIMLDNNGGWENNQNAQTQHTQNAAGAAHQKAKQAQDEISIEDIPF